MAREPEKNVHERWLDETETGLGQISCTEASMHQLTLPKILLTILTSKTILSNASAHVLY